MKSVGTERSAVVLVADGLRSSSLGPYGNTWFDTFNINRLAAKSLLFEYCISDTPDPQVGFNGFVSAQHCCQPESPYFNPSTQIAEAGVQSVLITMGRNDLPAGFSFDVVVEVEPLSAQRAAADIADTELANYFAAAIQAIREIEQPTLLVLDCPAFSQPWDAPVELRESLLDDEDPPAIEMVAPPKLQYNASTDAPDLLFGFQTAYNAQVIVFDRLLGLLLEEIERHRCLNNALFCLTATRSFPLGEHDVVGYYRPTLYNESLHVPAILRYPKTESVLGRSHQLIQPASLSRAVFQWLCDAPIKAKTACPLLNRQQWLPDKKRSLVVSKSAAEIECYSLQTCAWKYISGPAPRLYVRPDDIWEHNNTHDLCLDIAESMQRYLKMAIAEIENGCNPNFELPDELAFGIE